MKLTLLLIKLGLLAPAAEAPTVDLPPLEKRVLKLADMRREADAAREREEEAALGLDVSLEKIYEEAGIATPAHGLTGDALVENIRGKSDSDARADLLIVLTEKNAPREEVLEDARRRDEALDRHEERLVARVTDWVEDARAEVTRKRDHARRLLAEADGLETRIPEVETRLSAWRARKEERESGLERLGLLLAPDNK
ncbi:MAG: hypothetical protein FJX76_21625 [Armatimonadetes bacterium]|nr:hypothetical protein [Armatimonadota bacterium]